MYTMVLYHVIDASLLVSLPINLIGVILHAALLTSLILYHLLKVHNSWVLFPRSEAYMY